MGTSDIVSTPPTTTTSLCPEAICAIPITTTQGGREGGREREEA